MEQPTPNLTSDVTPSLPEPSTSAPRLSRPQVFALFVLTLLDDESGVAIGLHDFLIHHVLLLLLFLPIAKHVPRA
jgi:hypothetical protein